MLSTAFPQPIDLVAMVLLAVNTIALILLFGYVAKKSRRDFPTKHEINVMRSEVSDLSGMQADLSDRFTRFQKREGMRVAREEKVSQADLKQQALEMMQAQGTGATSNKADLYKKLRN